MSTAQKSRTKQAKAITLKGSTEIVTDFFKFAVNAYVREEIQVVLAD